MKFGMERSLKMKVVCTWRFDLKVDFDHVMQVTSEGVPLGVTRKLLVILFSKFTPNLAATTGATARNFRNENCTGGC
jgi:hypothetical protein